MSTRKFTIDPAWVEDPGLFEKFMRETDVFGHRMCDDPRVAARERKREEAIEEFLYSSLAPSMAMHREIFRKAKDKYLQGRT